MKDTIRIKNDIFRKKKKRSGGALREFRIPK